MNKEEQFWKQKGGEYLKPHVGGEFPEGFPVIDYLGYEIGDKNVLEVGCGDGRLCGAFSPHGYLGLDINQAIINTAGIKHPGYKFQSCSYFDIYPASDVVLLYTLLLHIADENIEQFLKNITESTKKIVIAEILGRAWRREGIPPVYNREEHEYINILKTFGFRLDKHNRFLYARYENFNMQNKSISFMFFEKWTSQC